jgi:3-oxoacid CoA-transferase subunit A
MAMAARVTLVEVEEQIIALGGMDPDQVHTPGICVDRVVHIPPDGIMEEAIYRD